MKLASVKKLFIKAFTSDGSTKSLLVDEKMTCGYVTRLLADKNHVTMEPKWAIVEHLPDLYMGTSKIFSFNNFNWFFRFTVFILKKSSGQRGRKVFSFCRVGVQVS